MVLRSITTGTFAISVFAILIALVAGVLLIALTNPEVQQTAGYFFARPSDMLGAVGSAVGGAYSALFNSAIYNLSAPTFALGIQSFTNTLSIATPFIAAGLGIALSFRVGLFNIGGQGQMLIAASAAGLVGFDLHLPPGIHLIVALLAGLLGGAVWAAIAGFLRARTGAHEVIVTIMLNYIALYLLNYFLRNPVLQAPGSNDPKTAPILPSAQYPALFGHAYGVDVGFIVVIAATIVAWWLLERSSLGFKFRAVGENPQAARVAGINVKSVYVWAMVISGVFVGLAAVSQVLGTTLQGGFGDDIDAGIGFTAITVALLGRSRPLGVFVAGILFGALQNGGPSMQAAVGVPVEVVAVIQAVIVLFVAAPPLVRAIFRLPSPTAQPAGKRSRRSKEVAAR
ncbi:MAG: ABC transporter permease [Microbacteriaceae bacterium]|nr:MAG: ABC transporter permease [Microbacteriaceae bacterium]